MKPILIIIKSLFKQNFWAMLPLIMGIGMLPFMVVINISGQQYLDSVIFSIFGVFMISIALSNHIKELLKGGCTEIIPHYKRNLLIGAGIILLIVVGWTTAFNVFWGGFSVLSSVSLFLSFSLPGLYVIFLYGENLIALTAVFWLYRFIYELFGFPSDVHIFGSVQNITIAGSKELLHAGLLILWLVSLYFFYRFFYKMPPVESDPAAIEKFNKHSIHSHDRPTKYTALICSKIISSIYKTRNEGLSSVNVYKLMRLSLFSPGYSVANYGILGLITFGLYMSSVVVFTSGDAFTTMKDVYRIPAALIILYVAGMGLSTDFLQHRHRIPFLWLQTKAQGRRDFIGSVIRVYLIVGLKMYILMAAGLALLGKFFFDYSYTEIAQFVFAGVPFVLSIIALSLLLSKYFTSGKYDGWTVLHIFFVVFLFVFSEVYRSEIFTGENWIFTHSGGPFWILFSTFWVFSLGLMWIAYQRWCAADLDFKAT